MLRVAVCDDDRKFSGRIKELLLKKFVTVIDEVNEFLSGNMLVDEIKSGNKYQMIILDKEMEGLDGIETAKKIRDIPEYEDVMIFFVTAHDSDVVSVTSVHPREYIKKPIDENDFEKKISDAIDYIDTHDKVISLRKKNSNIIVNPIRIYYIESLGHISRISYKNRKEEYQISKQKLYDQIEKNFPVFVQIHRAYIINLKYIEHINNEEVIMRNGDVIPIGRRYRSCLLEKYREYYLI